MKTTLALIIKFIVTFVAAWISFLVLGNVSLTFIFVIATAVTIINYMIGDLLILPRLGNIIAPVSDVILSAIISYVILLNYVNYTAISIAYFAVIVGFLEIVFHMFLLKTDIVRRKDSDNSVIKNKKLNHSTEVAEEIHPLPSSYMGTGPGTTVHNSKSSDNVRDQDGE